LRLETRRKTKEVRCGIDFIGWSGLQLKRGEETVRVDRSAERREGRERKRSRMSSGDVGGNIGKIHVAVVKRKAGNCVVV
jgi:hypothetical protein